MDEGPTGESTPKRPTGFVVGNAQQHAEMAAYLEHLESRQAAMDEGPTVPMRVSGVYCRTCAAHTTRQCVQEGHDVVNPETTMAPTIRPETVEYAELYAKLEKYVARLYRFQENASSRMTVSLVYGTVAAELVAILAGTYDPRKS